MPADVEEQVQVGILGLNLRDSPLEVGINGLTDTLNWRLDSRGALVKTLGDAASGFADFLSHPVLELAAYNPSTSVGSSQLIAYANNGTVYKGDPTTPTVIKSGLSASAVPSFAQMLDKIYWSNGTDEVGSWDGSTYVGITGINDVQTLTTTGVPTGGTFTLTYPPLGVTTTALQWNDTAANVQAALRLILGSSNVSCTGGALPTGIVITFQGALGFALQPALTFSNSLTGGTNPTPVITHTTPGRGDAPKGKYLAVWRNRLWVAGVAATPNRVFWSGAGDPTVWPQLNYVDILGPRGDLITGLASAPNIGQSSDGSDGVLVFKTRSTHRVVDDTDNTSGAVVGGANVLVDGATGTINNRTVRQLNGRVYCVAGDGIYSTDGHNTLVLESAQLGSLISTMTPPSNAALMTAIPYRNSYLLATPQSSGTNSNGLVFEVYSAIGRTGEHPIMVLRKSPNAWTIYTDSAAGDRIMFTNSSTPLLMFSGGLTFTGIAISASATTGLSLLGVNAVKRLRRIRAVGRGQMIIGAVTDFEVGQGDQQQFLVDVSSNPPLWNVVNWNEFNWAGAGDSGVFPVSRYYGTRGRWFGFVISESSTQTTQGPASLGTTPAQIGGAALQQMILTLVPLNGEV